MQHVDTQIHLSTKYLKKNIHLNLGCPVLNNTQTQSVLQVGWGLWLAQNGHHLEIKLK